ncbi:MAG: beta-phosphoglucomutase [Clostridiaceae bacterium]
MKKGIEGVIFDLDGVIVTTDEYHYRAWKQIAMDEEIYFDRKINERLRGVSRMQSLEIILERTDSKYTEEEKARLAERKNNYYREYINQLNSRDILPGALSLLEQLKTEKIRIAVGSSSKNCDTILERIGLSSYFDAVVSGNDISRSKPDPEVFLLAAKRLCLEPGSCLVVEDALAGVTAALQAGMKVLAVGSASSDRRATIRAADLSKVTVEEILAA